MGFDLENKVVSCERKKTGQLVASNQIVCPYQPDIMTYDGKASTVDDDGHILVAWYNDVKKNYYDEDEDEDDPYKIKRMAHDIKCKWRRHLLDTRLKKKVKGEFNCRAWKQNIFLELTTWILPALVENAKKNQRIAGANYVSANLARQFDFAAAAHCDENFVDDRKPAGENKKENFFEIKEIITPQSFDTS
jgi:hypothetical protein